MNAQQRQLWDFRVWMLDLRYSKRTTTVYGQYVKRTAVFLDAQGTTLARARPEQLYAFWSTLPSTRSSRNGLRGALVAFYRSDGKPDGGPAKSLPVAPAPHRLPRPLEQETYESFLSTAVELGGIYSVIGAIFAYTGCRREELRQARWHQFDLVTSPCWYIVGKGSNRRGPKTRQVPIHPELVPILQRWRGECGSVDWLFPSPVQWAGAICGNTLRKLFNEICETADIGPCVPHQMRHTVATLALDRSRDVRAVQELLGHESLSSTQIYTKVLPGRLAEVVALL